MMCQTFKTVIDSLIESKKIAIDAGGRVCWIFDPDLTRHHLGREDLPATQSIGAETLEI